MIESPWLDLRASIKQELTGDLTAGNHFAVIAPTGGGKTTLVVKGILPMFANTADVLLIDSTADPKLAGYGKPYQKYGKIKGVRRLTVGNMSGESSAKIAKALSRAYKQGEVVICFDEVRHICDKRYLGLQADAEYLWLFSRKRKTIIGGLTQAPRYVPSAFYDQSKMHFIFRIRDRRAMLRLAEIGGDYDTLKATVPTLDTFEFAYVAPNGDVTTSKLDLTPRPRTVRVIKRDGLTPSTPTRKLGGTLSPTTGSKEPPKFLR